MKLKKISLERHNFSYEDTPKLKKLVKQFFQESTVPMFDIDNLSKVNLQRRRRETDYIFKDLLLAFILCNNVTPSYHEGIVTYQASSPDEIAFVKFCETINLKLIKRDQKSI